MGLGSKNLHQLVLAGTAIVCSKIFFFLLDDPEGPNLLIVMGLAIALYGLSAITYPYLPFAGLRKLLVVILVQFVITILLFLGLRSI